jgi:hypothetical protein
VNREREAVRAGRRRFLAPQRLTHGIPDVDLHKIALLRCRLPNNMWKWIARRRRRACRSLRFGGLAIPKGRTLWQLD